MTERADNETCPLNKQVNRECVPERGTEQSVSLFKGVQHLNVKPRFTGINH